MDTRKKPIKTIDDYIAQFPRDIQEKLQKLRKTIGESAPQATEAISYQIPTFKLNGNLVHFAAFKDHISFFPTSSGVAAFEKELSRYKISKGTIQFPLDTPIPLDLVRRIVKFRVQENLGKIPRSPRKKKGPTPSTGAGTPAAPGGRRSGTRRVRRPRAR